MKPERRVILLQLVPSKPKCFDSYHQWREYAMTAAEASHSDDKTMEPFTKDGYGQPSWNPQFNFCKDCDVAYKAQMVKASRCAKAEAKRAPVRVAAPVRLVLA